jgi:hypothetical protein
VFTVKRRGAPSSFQIGGLFLVSLALVGGVAAAALVGHAPAAPRLLAHPAAQTPIRTATFRFSDAGRVSFQCSVNSAGFRPCQSPVRYAQLRQGAHRFRVRARARGGALSRIVTFRWSVQPVRPQLQVAFPRPGGDYRVATWPVGCVRGPGACGTVQMPRGVAAIFVSIRSNQSHRYWNGRRFASRKARFEPATVSPRPIRGRRVTRARWYYRLPRPARDGAYTLRVRAMTVRRRGRVGIQGSSAFGIDTVPPAAPLITAAPANPTTETSASFGFTGTEAALQFQCQLDAGQWQACVSPTTYPGLSSQVHVFNVRTIDQAGNISPVTAQGWQITPTAGGAPLTISGNAAGTLYPGGPVRSIALTLHNSASNVIDVTGVAIAVQASSLPAGCVGADYRIVAPVIPSSGIEIPANASVTLPSSQIAAPAIQMVDTGRNQDACRGARLVLTYSGNSSS